MSMTMGLALFFGAIVGLEWLFQAVGATRRWLRRKRVRRAGAAIRAALARGDFARVQGVFDPRRP